MNKYLFLIIITILLVVAFSFATKSSNDPDDLTKKLCREYAERDHEKELSPERWQMFVDKGIDLNKDFDWYQSCLAHSSKQQPAQGLLHNWRAE